MLSSQGFQLVAQFNEGREGYGALWALASATSATNDATVRIGDMGSVVHSVDSSVAELDTYSASIAALSVYRRKPLYLLSRYPVIALFELAKALSPELLELRPDSVMVLFLH